MKLGVDKSQLDGPANYDVMALRGISFVTMRASWETYADTAYLNDAPKAMQAGLAVMPYHWYKPKIDPVKQAEVFLASVKNSIANLPPLLDLEDNGRFVGYKGIATKELKVWLDIVEQKSQQTPYLYLSPSYCKSYLTDDTFLTRYPIIMAHWDTSYPLIPKPFTPDNLQAWQFGDNRDARYYGFLQSKGCALYVWTGEEYETQEWNR